MSFLFNRPVHGKGDKRLYISSIINGKLFDLSPAICKRHRRIFILDLPPGSISSIVLEKVAAEAYNRHLNVVRYYDGINSNHLCGLTVDQLSLAVFEDRKSLFDIKTIPSASVMGGDIICNKTLLAEKSAKLYNCRNIKRAYLENLYKQSMIFSGIWGIYRHKYETLLDDQKVKELGRHNCASAFPMCETVLSVSPSPGTIFPHKPKKHGHKFYAFTGEPDIGSLILLKLYNFQRLRQNICYSPLPFSAYPFSITLNDQNITLFCSDILSDCFDTHKLCTADFIKSDSKHSVSTKTFEHLCSALHTFSEEDFSYYTEACQTEDEIYRASIKENAEQHFIKKLLISIYCN